MEYGKQKPGSVPGKRRSNRHSVEWVPVIDTTKARAVLAAEALGIDLAIWMDEAIHAHLERAEFDIQESRYRDACRVSYETGDTSPQRWEFFPERKVGQPFVRPAPEASGLKSAGRPSSRRQQMGRGAETGSTAAKPGPERPAATRSAASMARTREDPPVDPAEHSGTSAAKASAAPRR